MNNKFEEFSKKLTYWIGSPQSILIHTIFFGGIFILRFFGVASSEILLVLTTIVSLEAIYLSIFIQMTVNKHAEELEEVSEDIGEIQKDVDEIQEDVEGIQKDVDEIQEDVEGIEKDVDEIQEDVEDIEEEKPKIIFEKIEKNLQDLMAEISELKKKSENK
jgi:uncharacterized protein YoxC